MNQIFHKRSFPLLDKKSKSSINTKRAVTNHCFRSITALTLFPIFNLPVPDHRTLFRLFPYFPAFQSKDHIPGTLKISYILLPAHAAFTVLQADKLLFHLPAAVRAYLFAHAFPLHFWLIRIIFLLFFLFGNPILRYPHFIAWKPVKIQTVYFIKGSLFRYPLYPLINLPCNLLAVLSFRHPAMLPVIITGLFKHTVRYLRFLFLL